MLLLFLVLIILFIVYSLTNKNYENFKNKRYKRKYKLDKVYIVNLEKDIDRWKHLKIKAKKENINLTRFNAILGKNVNKKSKEFINRFGLNTKLKDGQIGCALSHINLWTKIKNSKDNIILILEDDAIIPDKFWINYQKYMAELPKNWDMVLFGGSRLKGHSYTKHLIKPKKTIYGNWGTFAYIIKKSTANKLLKTCSSLYDTIDHHLNKRFYCQNNVFFANPQMIKHDYDSYSTINGKKRTDDAEKNNKVEID